jgi:hypothetical protein
MSEAKTKIVPKFDLVLAGVIVAFDAETGDPLHVHEKYVETVDDKPICSAEITSDECEKIRAEATRNYPRRRVDVITERPELDELEGQFRRYHVDPMTRRLRVETECDPHHRKQLLQIR